MASESLRVIGPTGFFLSGVRLINRVVFCQQIMKDCWINAGAEEEELKPFIQPDLDIRDQARIGRVGQLTLGR